SPAGGPTVPAAPSLATVPAPRQDLLSAPQLTSTGMRWGGYVTLEYLGATNRNSNFDLHRLILTFDTQITDCVDASMELEIEHGGVGGGNRDGDVKLEHFTVNWRLADAFNIKLGAPIVPFGRYNLYHDDPLNDFTNRPWVARYMVPTGFGQPGIGIFGSWQAGCGTLAYDVLVSSGFSDGFTNSGGVRNGRQSWRSDNNENKQVWGRMSYTNNFTFFDYLEAGLSGTYGRYDDAGENDLFGVAADLLLRKGPWELQGEYYQYDIERDDLDPATAVRGQSAWYAQLAYHFFPCAWRHCRSCLLQDTSHFTLAARIQSMDLDDRVSGASFNDDLMGYALALNYRLNERTVFRLDHQWLEPEKASSEREWSFSFSTYF
ncbi:MAG: porin, partial [Planctomycetota bacterium]|nr:porin [Planctomycetota bacterium]